PTPQGLISSVEELPAAPGAPLAASGRRLAVVDPDGDLRLTEPAEELPGPVTAVVGVPGGFAWIVAGEAAALHRTGAEPIALDAGATGLAAGAGQLWVLDAPGRRLRHLDAEGWVALPVEPRLAEVLDADADGCPD